VILDFIQIWLIGSELDIGEFDFGQFDERIQESLTGEFLVQVDLEVIFLTYAIYFSTQQVVDVFKILFSRTGGSIFFRSGDVEIARIVGLLAIADSLVFDSVNDMFPFEPLHHALDIQLFPFERDSPGRE